MLKSMRIFACSLGVLVGLAPLAASAGQVMVRPDNIPQECLDDINDDTAYSGPVSVYTALNIEPVPGNRYQVKFRISESDIIAFNTEFQRDFDAETLQQVKGYIKKKKGLFVAFFQPGTAHLGPDGALPVSFPESKLDFFLIASIRMGNGNPPVCRYLSDPVGLPQEAYKKMPGNIQILMDWVNKAQTRDMANAFSAFNKQQTSTSAADDDIFN